MVSVLRGLIRKHVVVGSSPTVRTTVRTVLGNNFNGHLPRATFNMSLVISPWTEKGGNDVTVRRWQ